MAVKVFQPKRNTVTLTMNYNGGRDVLILEGSPVEAKAIINKAFSTPGEPPITDAAWGAGRGRKARGSAPPAPEPPRRK